MTADESAIGRDQSAIDRVGLPSVDDLDTYEVRVLGCLIEKEATTPDVYPLTLNSLRSTCNQSTSRDPVVAFTDPEIERALASLHGRGLTRTVHSTSNRAIKFRHVLPEVLRLEPAETAVLSVLMLPRAANGGRTQGAHRAPAPVRVDRRGGGGADCTRRPRPSARAAARTPTRPEGRARWVHLLAPFDAQTAARGVADRAPEDARAAPTQRRDPYGEATAEFYDLLETAMWDNFGLQMLDVLASVDPADGPIIDVGSGTGIGLAYLRAAVPGARLIAIEPSKAMRVALHTRASPSSPNCANRRR